MCEHKWKIGSVIFVEDEPRIKTRCVICGKDIVVDFKKESAFVGKDNRIGEERWKKKGRLL